MTWLCPEAFQLQVLPHTQGLGDPRLHHPFPKPSWPSAERSRPRLTPAMPGSKWPGTGCFPRSGHKTWVTGSWGLLPTSSTSWTCCETQKSHCLSLSLSFLCHSRSGAYRDAGFLSFSQTDKSSQNLGLGVAEALTWYRAMLAGS